MAKITEVFPVSEYQLVQLASVAVAVRRAENVTTTEAIEWLGRQVDDHQLPSRLFSLPMSPGERVAVWSADGDASQWKLIREKAVARQVDANKMPTVAQSRWLHVDDVAKLAASPDTSEACRTALLELVARRKLKRSEDTTPAVSTGSGSDVESPVRPAARQPQPPVVRHDTKQSTNLLKPLIELARKNAADPEDWMSAWTSFVAMAKSDQRPRPLLGFEDGDGVRYETYDDRTPVRVLNQEAFRGRFRTAAKKRRDAAK